MEILIDLHTASFGRINSYYLRVDMLDPVQAKMADLLKPQIILHNSGQDGTLRGVAAKHGIKAITVEAGNPQRFQVQIIQWFVASYCTAQADTHTHTHTHTHTQTLSLSLSHSLVMC
jgi:predicted deacylase